MKRPRLTLREELARDAKRQVAARRARPQLQQHAARGGRARAAFWRALGHPNCKRAIRALMLRRLLAYSWWRTDESETYMTELRHLDTANGTLSGLGDTLGGGDLQGPTPKKS